MSKYPGFDSELLLLATVEGEVIDSPRIGLSTGGLLVTSCFSPVSASSSRTWGEVKRGRWDRAGAGTP
jgi:hypothetical protein